MKHLLVLMLFFSAMTVTAQGLESSDQNLQTTQNENVLPEEVQAFYNTLYSKDCSVPEGTQILHYPTVHKAPANFPPIFTAFELDKIVSLSQWQMLQLIRQHPNALVFSELFWTEESSLSAVDYFNRVVGHVYYNQQASVSESVNENNEDLFSEFMKVRRQVLEELKTAKSFEELDETNKNILYYGGSIVALSLGIIDRLYPTTLLSSEDEALNQYWMNINKDPEQVQQRVEEINAELMDIALRYKQEESVIKQNQLKESFRVLFEEKRYLISLNKDMVSTWRERLLFESVRKTLMENSNQDKMVIITYGVAHDFSDDFKDYNFYKMPYSCSFLDRDNMSAENLVLLIANLLGIKDQSQRNMLSRFLYDSVQNMSEDSLQPIFSFYKQFGANTIVDEEIHVELIREVLIGMIQHLSHQAMDDWEIVFGAYIAFDADDGSQITD